MFTRVFDDQFKNLYILYDGIGLFTSIFSSIFRKQNITLEWSLNFLYCCI